MIDAHVHIWRIGANGCTWPPADVARIHRDFALDDYRAGPGAAAVDSVILVQSQEDDADTRWLLDVAANDPIVCGVIGWADLGDAEAIARLACHAKICGVRPMVQDHPADWFDDPALDDALAAMMAHGLVLDALIRPAHLPALDRLAAQHPDLAIVIDHAAKPDFDAIDAWQDAIRHIAARPNVFCKLSGLLTELQPGQPADRIEQAIAVIRDAFGADRLIWGSDWPVVLLASDLASWHDQTRALFPPAEHDALFGGNAKCIYGLAA